MLLLAVLFACKSPEKLLQQGDYDEVIDRGIKKQLKGKADNADRELMDKAYRLANERDQSRIHFLLQEGKPENWDEIYRRYLALSNRQDRIQKILPYSVNGKVVDYTRVDYSEKIVEAKTNAARFYFERAEENMRLNTKEAYRQAYADYGIARDYRAVDYPGIGVKIERSRELGISRVLIEYDNKLQYRLPREFFDEIDNLNTARFNSQWVEYHLAPLEPDMVYDYYIAVVLNSLEVIPPLEEREEYIRQKRVQDGFDYVLDNRGNVMKDTLGNDIKVPRYKDLSARVIRIRQYQSATLKGEVEFMATHPNRLLKRESVQGTSVFEHVSGKATGHREALLPEDLDLIQLDEVPFPAEERLIMDCVPILRDAISDLIIDSRRLIY